MAPPTRLPNPESEAKNSAETKLLITQLRKKADERPADGRGQRGGRLAQGRPSFPVHVRPTAL